MLSALASNKLSLVMLQISILFLGILVTSSWAAPSNNDQQATYLETCHASCGLVSNTDQAQECRDKFCPNYVKHILTGETDADVKPSLVSIDRREVEDFCATWFIHLLKQFGWRQRVQLNLKECICAAGKDCLVK